ncbi:hypothetical protein [Flavivirga jejuensis]|uniref:Lipoprotein n=1 Tax=Flavivirga jejuensis TaxID=870487 RepID=A0ABT8WPN0_9FLAO|nr:hypothetical protein [Flavivirga jejuensis]MDO5975105.1 hypothetical protein [Flavivirga jejuensis]
MKTYLKTISLGIFILLLSCNESDDTNISNPTPTSDSFLPMHIGNYWKYDEDNYTEITDTLRIEGDLYYKFYSLIGGDAVTFQYLRIDTNQNLIQGYPDNPDFKHIHAKFNTSLEDTFWTLNNKSVNDFKATLIEKDDNLRTYAFQRFYKNPEEEKLFVSYIRGLGWNYNFYTTSYKQIKIDGEIYNF